jgi:hypothetical protein
MSHFSTYHTTINQAIKLSEHSTIITAIFIPYFTAISTAV